MLTLVSLIRQNFHRLTAAFFLSAAVLLLFASRGGAPGSGLEGGLLDLVGSLQNLLQSPVVAWRGAVARFQELSHLDEENRVLRAELERARTAELQNGGLLQENRRLRELLAMAPDPRYHALVARVVGDSSSAFSRSYLLSSGRRHGVLMDSPVIVPNGLVGRVVRVGQGACLVLSLQDLNSRVPVLIERSGVRAVAMGTNNDLLKLAFIAKGDDIVDGDQVVTSGIGGIFPKGLVVGKVAMPVPMDDSVSGEILVRSRVDFHRLEEVSLLLPVDEVPLRDSLLELEAGKSQTAPVKNTGAAPP
ncbi:MAG: rod shape-determining protein MreC [Magnetococcales bacterium]|nr:rod shape-determining protein MreC [Magnetococcales bacterium]MBF0155762.1 rod shape-determining protein MreC [Magnetococcales bacterium]